jgi:hypothetical protein
VKKGLLTMTVPIPTPSAGSWVIVVRGNAEPIVVMVVYGPVNKGLLTTTVPTVSPAAGGRVTVINGNPGPMLVTVMYGPANGVLTEVMTGVVTPGVLSGLLTMTVPTGSPLAGACVTVVKGKLGPTCVMVV